MVSALSLSLLPCGLVGHCGKESSLIEKGEEERNDDRAGGICRLYIPGLALAFDFFLSAMKKKVMIAEMQAAVVRER